MRRIEEIKIKITDKDEIEFLCGKRDENLKFMEKQLGVTFTLRDNFLKIKGIKERVERAGGLEEKVEPYLRPLYDALYELVLAEKFQIFLERRIIEIAPLAYMRGRTFNDAFIILDEAQNTTYKQMKMFLTRLGFGSKTVITGDITQIDLPEQKSSGLVSVQSLFEGTAGIKTVYLTRKDVVRHHLVQDIVKTYENYEREKKSS